MFFKQNQEQKLEELVLENERLSRQAEELFAGLQTTGEALESYLSNPAHFTEKNWREMQEIQTKLEEDLSMRLNNIPNPIQTAKKRAALNPQAHWLFVR